MKQTIFLTGCIIAILLAYSALSYANVANPLVVHVQDFVAGVFLADAVTEQELHTSYARAKKNEGVVRVLVVPGHTPENPGAEYRGMPEWNLTIKTALILHKYLEQDEHFEAFITQDKDGFTEEFETYFTDDWDDITEFISEKKRVMRYLMKQGVVNKNQVVDHVTVSNKIATELYGINKWANENDIDIVLHIHFNDYPGRYRDRTPQYSGFSLYVPERQYSNFKASRALASHLYITLGEYYAQSNLPKEKDIIIEDQDLIAVGAFNTLQSAVTLIEYGYLYEPQFVYSGTQVPALHDRAYQTYRGLKHYFDKKRASKLPRTTLFPGTWKENLRVGDKGKKEVLALQAYLTQEGFYPPGGRDRNECPLSGIFGSCTQRALQAFQTANEIQPASGFFGPLTREVIKNKN